MRSPAVDGAVGVGRRGVLAVLLTLAAVVLTPGAAAAHAGLKASTPANGARLETRPDRVTLAFTERPDPSLSRVEVRSPSGAQVAGSLASGPGASLSVTLAGDLGPGTYTVDWHVVSAVDGHPTAGVTVFGIGSAPVGAPAVASVNEKIPWLGATGRTLFYVGLLLALGAAATGLWVYGGRLAGRERWVGIAPVLLVVGLVLLAAGQWQAAGGPPTRVLASVPGRWLLARFVLVLIIAASAGVLMRQVSRRRLVLLGLAAGILTLVHVAAGHAAAPDPTRWLELIAQATHVLMAGVWVGGLVWLLAGLRQPGQGARAVAFSRMATIALVPVLVAGTWRAVDELGGWSGLWETGWGRTLAVKVALVGLLLVGGGYNRWRGVPRAVSDAAPLARGLRFELACAVAVLATTGLLASLGPGKPVVPPVAIIPRAGGTDYARVTHVDVTLTGGRLEATVLDRRQRPFAATSMMIAAVPADRPEQPPARIQLRREALGRFTGSAPILTIPGRWNLVATVLEDDGTSLRVPLDSLDVLSAS
jgi:copper transport protein